MNGFFKNSKGAVTVFVTLLLIPAMLVSGTAVDLARIHTVRSTVQDANQLAANSILTQYEAMLNDIYGLYAVMESDPILGGMLNEYIEISVLGDGGQDKSMGTFQLFYGSGLQPPTVTPAADQHLRNTDVLRRQIEEYAKFRVPVVIIKEVWERIDGFKKVKADSEVIEQKMAVDDKISEIDKIYKEIYNLINEINNYPNDEISAFESINSYLTRINEQLKDMETAREERTVAFDTGDSESVDDLDEKYTAIKQNIRSLVSGGSVGSGWAYGGWSNTAYTDGITQAIGDRRSDLNSYTDKLDDLVSKCEEADEKKAELSGMVDELEQKLESGECSDEIVNGMTGPQVIRKDGSAPIEETKPSVIEEYRDLLTYSLKPMADAMKDRNGSYIRDIILETLNKVDYGYGSIVNNEPDITDILTWDELRNLIGDSAFDVDNIVVKRTVPATDIETLHHFASLTNYKYIAPNGFKAFQDTVFELTDNREFYGVLVERYNSSASNPESKKDEAKNSVTELLKNAQGLFKTFTLTPDGAKYYRVEEGGDSSGFGNEGDWGNEDEANEQTQDALNGDILSQFGNFLDSAANKILLLSYDTEMFSNFTTEPGTETLSGIPMGTDVNYFFQSELEYLVNGNEKSARSNLAAVSGLIFLVRFVFNYASTFIIDEIKYELWLISSPAGPFAAVVRELARLGYAIAESAIDMNELLSKPGRAVPLFKNDIDQWRFSLHGAAIAGMNIPETVTGFVDTKREDNGTGMFYIDYLRIFLLFKDSDTLAHRTADLITWNMTNKQNGIGANEASMAKAALFDMSKAYTDFTITTTVDLRMLFLSMPFAQRGIEGTAPPKTVPITVTDYRGY